MSSGYATPFSTTPMLDVSPENETVNSTVSLGSTVMGIWISAPVSS